MKLPVDICRIFAYNGKIPLESFPPATLQGKKRRCTTMPIVTYTRKQDEPLTEEELKMLEEGAREPVVFDKDCPELPEEILKQFKRVNPSIS